MDSHGKQPKSDRPSCTTHAGPLSGSACSAIWRAASPLARPPTHPRRPNRGSQRPCLHARAPRRARAVSRSSGRHPVWPGHLPSGWCPCLSLPRQIIFRPSRGRRRARARRALRRRRCRCLCRRRHQIHRPCNLLSSQPPQNQYQ